MNARPDVRRLHWDPWNVEHIAKHGIIREEIEEVIAGQVVFRDGYKGRPVGIGATLGGRMLAVVVGPVPEQPGVYYTFSARPASRQERRRYNEAAGGEPS